MEETLKERWRSVCESVGFSCDNSILEYGLNFVYNVKSSSYLAKVGRSWGADAELTQSAKKICGGRHPFDLVLSGSKEDKRLFVEYALATRGKRRIRWSNGFKALVGLQDLTDEELNLEEKEENTEVVAVLPLDLWQYVKQERARAQVLEVVEVGGYSLLAEWFSARGFVLPPPPTKKRE